MKKMLLSFLVGITLCSSLFTGCGNGSTTKTSTGTTAAEDGITVAWCRETVNNFKALQPIAVPENLSATGVKVGGEFDVSGYFSVLKHISTDDGYVLDYVYITDQKNGGPILYVRPSDGNAFSAYDQYQTATHDTPRQSKDNSMIWLVKGTEDTGKGNRIQIDGTPQGYFEYAILQTLSNGFYLFGAAVANNKTIVCEKDELESIWAEIAAAGEGSVDATAKDQAQQLDYTPGVTFHPELVQVSFVLFYKYTRFIRYTCYISKEYPHFITNIKEEPLLDLNSTTE